MRQQSKTPAMVLERSRHTLRQLAGVKAATLGATVRAAYEQLVPRHERQFGWTDTTDPHDRARQAGEYLRIAMDPDDDRKRFTACLLVAYLGAVRDLAGDQGLHIRFANELLGPVGIRCHPMEEPTPAGDHRAYGSFTQEVGEAIGVLAQMLADGHLDVHDSAQREQALQELEDVVQVARQMQTQIRERVPAAGGEA